MWIAGSRFNVNTAAKNNSADKDSEHHLDDGMEGGPSS